MSSWWALVWLCGGKVMNEEKKFQLRLVVGVNSRVYAVVATIRELTWSTDVLLFQSVWFFQIGTHFDISAYPSQCKTWGSR